MDIYHTGREDASDDHKFINERLLELAIPDEREDGTASTLEDCLEMYFNNRIEVKRYLDLLERKTTLGSVRSCADSIKGHASHIEVAEVDTSQPSTPVFQRQTSSFSAMPGRPAFQRNRGASIIQEHYIDEKHGVLGDPGEGRSPHLKKEVMMPAWQFYSLIRECQYSPPDSQWQLTVSSMVY